MLQQLEAVGKNFHDATKHSPLSVMLDPNYVDASTQPSAYKRYPHFYRRFPLDENNSVHAFIQLTSKITFEKKYKNDSYQLRVNPSAGALYPTEIYVQIRGIKGLIDGIYHLEVATDSLTLIYELIDDGLESYIIPNHLVKGFIFLVSCVYFRSSWKYKNRSLRYCFLDSGHHLGTIEAAAYLHPKDFQVIFDFDKIALNTDLGFENKEFVTASVIAGEIKTKAVRKLRSQIPFVSPTDYFEINPFIETGYRTTVLPNTETNLIFDEVQAARGSQNALCAPCVREAFPKGKPRSGGAVSAVARQTLYAPFFLRRSTLDRNKIAQSEPYNCQAEQFLQTILTRRSARCFKKQSISQSEFRQIWRCLHQPLPAARIELIEIYMVVNRVEGMEQGVYRELHLLKSGDFSDKAKYLCVNQALARDSAVTFFFVSAYRNYQTASQCAGWLGHRLYLMSNYLNIGCSGIGAYYDEETQEFLGTDKDILYAIAIGR